jgi:hypothetical protein
VSWFPDARAERLGAREAALDWLDNSILSEGPAEAPPFQFREFEAEAISGGYKMSNGWRVQVYSTSEGISAQIGKERAIQLVALSPDLYTKHDGNVTMEFNRGPLGEDMVMSNVPSGLSKAQLVVVTSATPFGAALTQHREAKTPNPRVGVFVVAPTGFFGRPARLVGAAAARALGRRHPDRVQLADAAVVFEHDAVSVEVGRELDRNAAVARREAALSGQHEFSLRAVSDPHVEPRAQGEDFYPAVIA